MKKEIFNILFLIVVVLVVAWLYWPEKEPADRQSTVGPQDFILALSWQPAFCESRPNRVECRSQRKERYDTQNFSLHGLWPQPRNNLYCAIPEDIIDTDKKGRWNKLPKLDLSADLRKDLSRVMPGYRSNLHRHEWFKHGSCMGPGASPQKYFELSIAMLKAINKSLLRDLLADNIGRELTSSQIITAMEKSFGKGSGKRIGIGCKRDGRRNLITEVKISISYESLPIETPFESEFVQTAPTLPIGCKRGIIDPVGLQ